MPLERLGASRSFLRVFIEAVPGAVYAKDTAGRILLGNAAFAQAVGWQSGDYVGKDDLELLTDQDLARTVMENDQRIMAGQVRSQVEEMLRSEDGSTTYWLSTKAPFHDDDGNIVGLVGVSIDITERKRREQQEKLLAREIEHRNKNLLGVVQSVVRLTRAGSTEEFRDAVVGRLEALSRAQSVVLRERLHQVELRNLLFEELAAFSINSPGRISLEGPPVHVGTDAAQQLAMAFHELTTNAAKYGAFADESGRLSVKWKLLPEGGSQVVIDWMESRRPPVEAPARPGFGTRLIRSAVEHQLQGSLALMWEPNGLRCVISLPMQSIAPN